MEKQSELIGTRWFHSETGIEHLVVFLAHDSLTLIVDIESGQVVFMTEFGEEPILEELTKNYLLE
jgi:hypothetical protein